MTDKDKVEELTSALQWIVAEMTFIGHGSSKAIREAKETLERVKER